MTSFALTQAAKEDLRNIALFTEKRWGREQRVLHIRQFDDIFHRLAENPSLGKRCEYINKAYRKFPQGSHLIFYREEKSAVLIVRILHKNMDVESSLFPA